MKSFVGLFAFAALFGLVTAVAYWFVAHEEGTGTALLGFMFAALAFAAGYAVLAERDARLEGDNPNETNEQVAGEDLGIFTTATPYPILIAVSTLAVLAGAVWSPLLGVAGLIGMLLCFWRLGAESSRA
ncbi:MAG: cytochrome c oxidase subunit 4 [Candidatus Eremiobacteraeota bacterium]|nr:cytochrome c oxidase subunit 4 [Candidatus Eremiobacteraeota bacterium]